MSTRQCAVCGAEFTPRNNNQKYCSPRCSRTAYERKHRERSRVRTGEARAYEHAMSMSAPVSNEHIMRATVKPANTSAVRWRIELRRRANPERYEMLGRV